MGHSAKYGSYTLMLGTVPTIIHFPPVQSHESDEVHGSSAWEFEGFLRKQYGPFINGEVKIIQKVRGLNEGDAGIASILQDATMNNSLQDESIDNSISELDVNLSQNGN
eukprot:gene5794-11084_t